MSPLGIYGSPLHVLTNKKVEDKKACFKEQIISGTKDSFKAMGAVAGTAGAAAGVTAIVNKVKPSALDGIRNAYREASSHIMGVLKEAGATDAQALLAKFNKIPAAGKVAAVVGAASLAIVSSIHGYNQIGKMGGIEGKHEVK